MGLRARIRVDVEDFKRGFNEGYEDPALALPPQPGLVSGTLLGSTRVLLFGFLLAFEGVPLLPWGKPAAVALTLLAALLGSLYLGEHRRNQALRAIAVSALMLIVIRTGTPPTTSMLLIGAFMTSAASLATSFPFLYGVTAGIAVGAIATQVFDWAPVPSIQLLLSGRPWTPDRAGNEALHLAGFMFLTALIHFGRTEMEKFRERAAAAEAARETAVVDERARIARELHDVVSHHVTAMTLQAEAAAMTGDKQALSSVASAGREALTELRRMLGVLRHAPDGAGDNADMAPQPDLAQLDRLAERTTSGLDVRVEREGDVRPLPAGVELCVYRLVQEALTNSAKHGDATAVDVVLSYSADMITVEIRDNGKPLVAPRVRSGGLGLIGMQERVALLDGDLSTGPRADGAGYQVVARLPIAS